jgi:1,4-alpha-glucan branching enzyme
MNTPRKIRLKMVKNDPWLVPAEKEINDRFNRFMESLQRIVNDHGSLLQFADAYHYLGVNYSREHRGWFYREWAPHAEDLYLFGDFNDWQRYSHRLTRIHNGIWEIFLPEAEYRERFVHGSRIKVLVHSDTGWHEKIPAYIRRVIQDEKTLDYSGQLWMPHRKFDWESDSFRIGPHENLIIYECHIGMAQEYEGIGTFVEFADYLLPYIKNAGYNTLQIMAVAEHPYYGSFGYHVTNFFAVSSRFGTPEDLKYLIKKAHQQGIAVIMDLVHSHSAKNTHEGLNRFDGSDHQYFHPGERGNHPHWDSKIFDYGKTEVLQFLLSNVRYWLKEFHFDGFRFDGVTSMLYFHHGFRGDWDLDAYFREGVEWDAITYLQLANAVIKKTRSDAVSIAEDVSGMPGLCRPVREGGIGFDFRLGMAIPDYWIKILKEQKDEDWNIHEMWHVLTDRLPDVGTVAYCESHDQALVGDQTIAFRLMQSEMYFHMSVKDQNIFIDRGIALHKMIRLITICLGGQAYMNFIGNEFGHPDWIDFPREGNHWSYHYARRQWSLTENKELKYHYLSAFDREMIRFVRQFEILGDEYGRQLNMDEENKTIVFEKKGLVFLFNFHPDRSVSDYLFTVTEPGDYACVLNTDNPVFGGFGRTNETEKHITLYDPETGSHRLSVYNINRAAQVFLRT